jgi:hypothetical protein
MIRLIVSASLALLVSSAVFAQERSRTTTNEPSSPPPAAADTFSAQVIPRNSKIYIAPISSTNPKRALAQFESYLAAAIRKKNVPVVMVTDRSQADFEITGTAEMREPGWEKKIFGEYRDDVFASISVVNLKTNVVAYADSSYRQNANRGPRSSAEKLAKYLKKKIEDDEKELKKSNIKTSS